MKCFSAGLVCEGLVSARSRVCLGFIWACFLVVSGLFSAGFRWITNTVLAVMLLGVAGD